VGTTENTFGRHDSLKVTATSKQNKKGRRQKETDKRMPSAEIDLLTWTKNKSGKKVVQGSY
jgi:hypothetical protein